MFKRAFAVATILLTLTTYASAQETPTATPTAVPAKTLTCTNSKGSIAISLCGIRGCTATVKLGSAAPISYATTRTKNTDGSLTYKPAVGAKRKCTIVIGPLKYGSRKVLNANCASSLKGSSCTIG